MENPVIHFLNRIDMVPDWKGPTFDMILSWKLPIPETEKLPLSRTVIHFIVSVLKAELTGRSTSSFYDVILQFPEISKLDEPVHLHDGASIRGFCENRFVEISLFISVCSEFIISFACHYSEMPLEESIPRSPLPASQARQRARLSGSAGSDYLVHRICHEPPCIRIHQITTGIWMATLISSNPWKNQAGRRNGAFGQSSIAWNKRDLRLTIFGTDFPS
jgi:hypothetical protein